MFRILDKIGLLICLICLTWCGLDLFNYMVEDAIRLEKQSEVRKLAVKKEDEVSRFEIDWEKMKGENPDLIGWIYVPGCDISFPVVQSIDNADYLYMDFYGNYDEQGTPFLDSTASPDFSSDNSIIYAHSVTTGGMFTELRRFKNDMEFFDNHPSFYLLTEAQNWRVDILAFVNTEPYIDFYNTSFYDKEAIIQDLLSRSMFYNEHVNYNSGDLISLSTCDLDFGLHSDMRLLLTGVKVPVDEVLIED
ncbi:class B sortase [Ileibacterium valens]|uniref:class B sortase n=1 Tax=Ileibacterium valens TaxID=1862668 RepID=UPI00257130BD|nr:class B sortase [Ileibacterium valens]